MQSKALHISYRILELHQTILYVNHVQMYDDDDNFVFFFLSTCNMPFGHWAGTTNLCAWSSTSSSVHRFDDIHSGIQLNVCIIHNDRKNKNEKQKKKKSPIFILSPAAHCIYMCVSSSTANYPLRMCALCPMPSHIYARFN